MGNAGADPIIIFDTTLRDGEQTPGINLNRDEKLEIARQLAQGAVVIGEQKFGLPCDAPEMQAIYRLAEERGVPVLMHWQFGSYNHGFDPRAYLAGIAPGSVWQFHLAGHSDKGSFLLDTHDHPVTDAVWDLYAEATRRFGAVSTLVEWDDHIPTFERLEEESERARARASPP